MTINDSRDINGRYLKGFIPQTAFKKGNIPWNKGTKGVMISHKKSPIVRNVCCFCGSSFEVPEYLNHKKYCSKLCFHNSRKGSIPWNKGIPCSAETIEKMSATCIEKYRSGESVAWAKGKTKLSDPRILKLCMSRKNVNIHTSIEIKLEECLSKNNIDFITQHPLYYCVPDIIIPNQRIAIFCDGDFWHGYNFEDTKLRLSSEWKTKIESIIKRDRLIDKQLFMHGWYPIRFWEHDINKNVQSCVDTIIKNMTIHARFISETAVIIGRPHIGEGTWIGHSTVLDGANSSLYIGKDCSISSGSKIMTHDKSYNKVSEGKLPVITGSITIGDNTIIGSNSVILPKHGDITIADHSIIGALTLVNQSFEEPYSVIVGIPGKFVKYAQIKRK